MSKYPLPERLYYTLEQAAKELGCDADYLLHLGATGRLTFYYSVEDRFATEGIFKFSSEASKIAEKEHKSRAWVYLPQIAINAVPTWFELDTLALQELETIGIGNAHAFTTQAYCTENGEPQLLQAFGDDDAYVAIDEATDGSFFDSEGCMIFTNENAHNEFIGTTTKEVNQADIRLFADEMERLKHGGLQSISQTSKALGNKRFLHNKPPHKNTELNAQKREKILNVAIACKKHWPDECIKPNPWAACICEKWRLFHPQEMDPPCTAETISGYLSAAEKLPK